MALGYAGLVDARLTRLIAWLAEGQGPRTAEQWADLEQGAALLTSEQWADLLRLAPADALMAEAGRRNADKRSSFGHRPLVMRPCPFCGLELGARQMREHRPHCPRKP
jgi:hypothetical protein